MKYDAVHGPDFARSLPDEATTKRSLVATPDKPWTMDQGKTIEDGMPREGERMMKIETKNPETLALHAGQEPDPTTTARAVQ